jgi:oxalate decarboxylase/phosphoglucose isomerase-like protein (cupin superfamily)
MSDWTVLLKRSSDQKPEAGSNAFVQLLRDKGDRVRRDVFLHFSPQETVSGRIQVGSTIVYPGCVTRGHQHQDREEVYIFTRGEGVMAVDQVEHPAKAGDALYIKPGPYHTTRNDSPYPLEWFWIIVRVD